MGFSLTQSSVIQYGSTLKLDFLFTYFHFEKISSFCSEIGHSRFCVASFAQLLEFSCAPDDFTAPRAQKRSLGRSLDQSKISSGMMLFIWPQLLKICPQVGPNFFHLAKEMATIFLEPWRTLPTIPKNTLLSCSPDFSIFSSI